MLLENKYIEIIFTGMPGIEKGFQRLKKSPEGSGRMELISYSLKG